MVPVKGKYGPICVGETWLGHYDKDTHFHPDLSTQTSEKFFTEDLIARYFLDFNPVALQVQSANYWPQGAQKRPPQTEFNSLTNLQGLVVDRNP